MGIRETLNRNPAITTCATIGIIILAIVFIIHEIWPNRAPKVSTKVFFTDDDGATYFAFDAKQQPPFMDDKGKEAVRAFVYKCNGKPFVAYMQKFTPEALKLVSERDPQGRPRLAEMRDMPGRLVKKPGDKDWVDMVDDSDDAGQVMKVKCPDGDSGEFTPVFPTP